MMTSTRLIFTLFAATLASCGGGGGGTSGGTTGGGIAPPVTELVKGTVADGYLRGVTVFWDCNGDRMRGLTEIATTSGAGGAFAIAPAPSAACRLTAQVPVGAIDEDRPGQAVSRPYVMTTPPGSEAFISPLTTMLATQMAQNPGQSLADARASVAQLLGVAEGKVTSNYVQDTSADAQRAGQVAQVVRVALQNNNTRVQPDAGLAAAQVAVAAMQPPLRNQTFASQAALDTFLDGQLNFFHLSSAPQFVPLNTDLVKVRPNTALSLTTQQQQVLQEVINDPAVKAVTRFGIINWQDLQLSEFEAVLARMQGRGLLGQETPAVLALRATRNAELQKWNDYYAANLQSKNKFLASDRAANLKFISSVALAAVEVTDAVLVGADKTGVYVKGSAYLKKNVIGVGYASGPERIRDGVLLLASSVDLGAPTIANLAAALQRPDSQELSKDQKDAVIELAKVLSDYVKVVARKRDWKGLISKLGPVLKLWEFGHDCSGVDVGQASGAECGAAALTVIEMAAEHFGVGHKVRGGIQALRVGFDAAVAGEEYAKAVDKEVYGSLAEVLAEWDAATKQLLLIYKFGEYQLGAYQQYFEAYLPGAFDGPAFAADFGLTRVGATWSFGLAGESKNSFWKDYVKNGIWVDYRVTALSGTSASVSYGPTSGDGQNATVGIVGFDGSRGLYLSGVTDSTPLSHVFPFLPALDYGVVEGNFFPAGGQVGQSWTAESQTLTDCEDVNGNRASCSQMVSIRTTIVPNQQTFAEICPESPLANRLILKPFRLEQVYTFRSDDPTKIRDLASFTQTFWMSPGYGFVAKRRVLSGKHVAPLLPGDLCLVSVGNLP